MRTAEEPRRPRVVIVGAGFGGLRTARSLRDVAVDVILLDRVNYHTFQPLLYQVATAGLEPEEIAHSVRAILRRQPNFSFRMGSATAVDWERRELVLSDGGRLSYDFLVLAVGAVTADYGIPGVAEHGRGLKSLADAVNLRAHVLAQFEDAARDPAVIERGALTFVIAGGGPTGVEMSGAMVELVGDVLRRDYPGLEVSRTRIVLLEREPHLLPSFHPSSREYARTELLRRGVEVRVATALAHASADLVVLESGERIPTRTLLWAAGVRANPLAAKIGLERTRGDRIVVNEDLSIPGHPEAYAIGDLAAPKDARGTLCPQLAPVAIQGGAHVAETIGRRLRGERARPFVYRDRGIMATIGRNAGVAELAGGLRLRGRAGWLCWLVLHLVQLIGFRNRTIVLLNWAWSYFTFDRGARLIVRVEELDAS